MLRTVVASGAAGMSAGAASRALSWCSSSSGRPMPRSTRVTISSPPWSCQAVTVTGSVGGEKAVPFSSSSAKR